MVFVIHGECVPPCERSVLSPLLPLPLRSGAGRVFYVRQEAFVFIMIVSPFHALDRDTGSTEQGKRGKGEGRMYKLVGYLLSFIGDATLARCVGEDRLQPLCAALCCGRYFPC